MSQYKIYSAEVLRYGPVGVVIATAFTEPEGDLYAESFVLIPDEKQTLFAYAFRADVKLLNDFSVELNEDFMLDEAVNQARIDLGIYLKQLEKDMGIAPPPGSPNILLSNEHLFLHVLMRGTCPHLKDVCEKTRCETLRDNLEAILKLPVLIITKTKL